MVGQIEQTDMSWAPSVSILICTYNRAELLRQTLLALEDVHEIEQAEVLVVDNNSQDHTEAVVQVCCQQLAHKVRLKYLFEERQGLSAARNTGMLRSRAPIIAFLDDDAVPEHGWLRTLMQSFKDFPDAGAVGGVIHPAFENGRPDWLIRQLEYPYAIINLGDQVQRYPRGLAPFGANMAVRRGAIGNLEFPENLGRKGATLLSGEETYFFGHLRKKGWSLYYHPEMAVRHHIAAERLNIAWIRKRYYYQGVSIAMEGTSLLSRLRIVSSALLRTVYASVQWLLARGAGHRLHARCRLDSVRGTMTTLYQRRSAATGYE